MDKALGLTFVKIFHLLIFGCGGSLLLRGLSLFSGSGGCSLVVVLGPLQWLLLLQNAGSRLHGFR